MKKFVLIFGAGTMAGVFGMGVANTLEKADFYDKIKAVYGYSAGSINAAYFLARQTYEGASVYWEDLTEGFISKNPLNFLFKKRHNANIDMILKIATTDKKLDIERIKKRKIPFYVKLLDVDTNESEFVRVDNSKQAIKLLHASVSIIPYYKKVVSVNGKKYVDGAIKEEEDFGKILKDHPKEKIILILNHLPFKPPSTRFFNLVARLASKLHFSSKISKNFKNKRKDYMKRLEFAMKSDRIIIIYPKKHKVTDIITTKRNRLLQLFRYGKKSGEQILKL